MGLMVLQDQQELPAQQGQLDRQVLMGQQEQQAQLVLLVFKDLMAQPGQQDQPGLKGLLAPLAVQQGQLVQ
jgi:hypothetical protein